MNKPSDLPVLRCPDLCCDKQVVTNLLSPTCPFCHETELVDTGFKYGEARAAADKYGFEEDIPIHVPTPVPELIQLCDIPENLWIGLPVYRPFSQEDSVCNWLAYDVGILSYFYFDPKTNPSRQCRFVTCDTGSLEYSDWNLWVPKSLAENLLKSHTST